MDRRVPIWKSVVDLLDAAAVNFDVWKIFALQIEIDLTGNLDLERVESRKGERRWLKWLPSHATCELEILEVSCKGVEYLVKVYRERDAG